MAGITPQFLASILGLAEMKKENDMLGPRYSNKKRAFFEVKKEDVPHFSRKCYHEYD
jgi:hypothetical protein